MVYMFALKGNFRKRIELSDMDFVSILIAAACHDYAHDGFTNAYHVQSMTNRALRYHDESVQENFHAAESMTLLVHKDNSFLENLEYDQIKVFRKRVVGLILATDMAKHMADLKSFKAKCESRGVNNLDDNIEAFIDKTDESTIFESQQDILDIC